MNAYSQIGNGLAGRGAQPGFCAPHPADLIPLQRELRRS